MQLQCLSFESAKSQSQYPLNDAVADQAFNQGLVHQLVVAYQANGRLGSKAQKSRSDVKSGGRKPWRQKGTGRARAGCKTGPLWRGGGVTFAATGDENYSQKINRKAYRVALRSILAQLLREDRLVVVEAVRLDAPKTKLMVERLAALNLTGRCYLLVDEVDPNVLLATSNLHRVIYGHLGQINPVAMVHCDHVVLSKGALQQLEGWLS